MSAVPHHTEHIPEWTLADRMRKSRTDAGYTAQQIADLIGIARKSVTNYEQGDTRPLRAILNAWAEVTNVPVWWLLGQELTSEYVRPRLTVVAS